MATQGQQHTAESCSEALNIFPDTEVHFRLDEEPPRCALTLRHVEYSTPHTLAFKVRTKPTVSLTA